MRSRKEKSRDSFNFPMLAVTLIASVLYGLGGIFLYDLLIGEVSRMLCVTLVLTLFLLLMGLTVLVASSCMGCFLGDLFTGRKKKTSLILYFLLIVLGSLALSVGFEYIYEIGLPQSDKVDTYVFLVDNSGSMSTSDPEEQRYSSIRPVLEGQRKGARYMVYSFASDVGIDLNMTKDISRADTLVAGEYGGGTMLFSSLSQVMSDYRAGVWKPEHMAALVLITDGLPTEGTEPMAGLIDDYVQAGIPISTVCLKISDEKLLRELAEGTGGKCVSIDDASGLIEAMSEAADHNDNGRTLLNSRRETEYRWGMGAMRTGFLTVLYFLVGLICAVAYGNSYSFNGILLTSAIKSLGAAVLEEVFLNVLDVQSILLMLLPAVLIGTLFCNYGIRDMREDQMLDPRMLGSDDPFNSRGSFTFDGGTGNFDTGSRVGPRRRSSGGFDSSGGPF